MATPSVFQYESNLADLSNKYAQDDATSQYARFVSKQRFGRDRQDANKAYGRAFPQFTGNWAHRLGSGIKSGVFEGKLNENVGDYNTSLARMDEDEAGFDSNWTQTQSMRQNQYQTALMQLNEQLQATRASQDPFEAYKAVYS